MLVLDWERNTYIRTTLESGGDGIVVVFIRNSKIGTPEEESIGLFPL